MYGGTQAFDNAILDPKSRQWLAVHYPVESSLTIAFVPVNLNGLGGESILSDQWKPVSAAILFLSKERGLETCGVCNGKGGRWLKMANKSILNGS
ncbi:unnamed protein product [Penicillium roqueforti FM164]|uniref:Uncharacterized protein n=1 Tax=Penicillium roqueforti (strain FM164) TaxID=1365484 RepID=W6QS12_PENRF|nr:unnamed protein product [Penicillium roqueforti FM164]